MRAQRFLLVSLVVFDATACVTTQSRPLRSEFEDIPVPKGLAYVDSQSVIIESPPVKPRGRIYAGRSGGGTLPVALRTRRRRTGWRPSRNTPPRTQGPTKGL